MLEWVVNFAVRHLLHAAKECVATDASSLKYSLVAFRLHRNVAFEFNSVASFLVVISMVIRTRTSLRDQWVLELMAVFIENERATL
jgi:hypothetical protein